MSDIAELFARDPLDLTEQDLDKIIARFREVRQQFNNQPIGKQEKKPKNADVAKLADELDIKI